MLGRIFFTISLASLCFSVEAATPLVLKPEVLKKVNQLVKGEDKDAAEAYKQLVKSADKALKQPLLSVMDKEVIPPSGDKHDYMSIAPYWFPNPDTEDGLPYVRKDGVRNPEVDNFVDKLNMPRMIKNVETLALAYYFTGERAYAKKAADFVRVWFLNVETKMNPNLNYAQAIKGRNDGRGAGLIETRHFIRLLDAVNLISDSKKDWTQKDDKELQDWFREFLGWMQTSEIGKHEMRAKNNHGVFYDAQRLAYAMYVGENNLAKEAIENAKGRLDIQMNDEGAFPEELERTIGVHYSVFVLNAFVTIADMSDKMNVDFWSYESPTGKSLKKGITWIAPYIGQEKEWPYQQIKPFNYEDAEVMMRQAAKKLKEPKFEKIAEKVKSTNPSLLRMVQIVSAD
ncbi:MAG: alginate lyase family protein [Prevotellaceae bacterium]|jgi:hypothetical protein|nr:alginate lyase family protein [Prevotellaceae bacterium]